MKDLKENIFELEDQVEQHRAVNCHANQAVLDMESMVMESPPQRSAECEGFRLETIHICHCRSGKEAGGAES